MKPSITHKRVLSNPQTGFLFGQNSPMPKNHKIDEQSRGILAANLGRLMEDGGFTNETLGKKSDVGRSTIQRIRQMETSPSLDNLAALAEALGVGLVDLLSKGGQTTPESWAVVDGADLMRLISNYAHATPDGKRQILDASEEAEKQSSGRFLIDIVNEPKGGAR